MTATALHAESIYLYSVTCYEIGSYPQRGTEVNTRGHILISCSFRVLSLRNRLLIQFSNLLAHRFQHLREALHNGTNPKKFFVVRTIQ